VQLCCWWLWLCCWGVWDSAGGVDGVGWPAGPIRIKLRRHCSSKKAEVFPQSLNNDKQWLFRSRRVVGLEKVDRLPSPGVTTTDSSRGTRRSTSLLYQRFGVVGDHSVRQSFAAGATLFRSEQPRERLRCSAYGADAVWGQAGVERSFRTLPRGKQPTILELQVPRVYGCNGGQTRPVHSNFADPKKHDTRSFARSALERSQRLTSQDVADQLLVSGDTSKDIQASPRRRRFGKPKLPKRKQSAIAASTLGKGHRYLTSVLNLLTGAVGFVGAGKGGDALQPCWQRLRRSPAQLAAGATDRSPASTRAVRDNLRGVVQGFEHCQVLQWSNERASAPAAGSGFSNGPPRDRNGSKTSAGYS
jgi:hypothetical protein